MAKPTTKKNWATRIKRQLKSPNTWKPMVLFLATTAFFSQFTIGTNIGNNPFSSGNAPTKSNGAVSKKPTPPSAKQALTTKTITLAQEFKTPQIKQPTPPTQRGNHGLVQVETLDDLKYKQQPTNMAKNMQFCFEEIKSPICGGDNISNKQSASNQPIWEQPKLTNQL